MCFGSYFFSCRPRPKPSLLDGWKTSMDGSAGRGRSAGGGRWAPSAAPSTPSPPPPAKAEPQSGTARGDPQPGGKFGDPRGMHVPVPGAGGGTPVTHIEEADVHVEVDVHVVDGPVLPAKTHGTVPGGQGEAGAARGRGGHPRRGGGGHARLPGHQTWAPPRPGRHRERAWVPQGRHGPVLRGRRSRVPGGTVWGCGGPSARPPDGHGILAVDLPHGVDVGVQLRVPVQVGGAGPLRHGAVAPSDLELPRRAAPHSGAGAGRGLPSPLPRGTHRTRRPQRSPGRRRGTPRTRCPRRSHRPSNTGP